MAVSAEVSVDMAGTVLAGGGWCTPGVGAARAASRPLVWAAIVKLASAGPAVMGWTFFGPIRRADEVADN